MWWLPVGMWIGIETVIIDSNCAILTVAFGGGERSAQPKVDARSVARTVPLFEPQTPGNEDFADPQWAIVLKEDTTDREW